MCFFSGNRFQEDRKNHLSDNLKNTLQCIDNYDDDDDNDVDDVDDNDDLISYRDIALTFVHSNFSLVAGEIKNIPLSLSISITSL